LASEGSPLRRLDGRLKAPEAADDEDRLAVSTSLTLEVQPGRQWGNVLADVYEVVELPSKRFGADPEKVDEWAYCFVYSVAAGFEFFTSGTGVRTIEIPGSFVEFAEQDGRIAITTRDPYHNFIAALERAEIDRIRKCEICGAFFYAVRKDKRACSKSCNDVRRMRKSRAKQTEYEYNRYLKLEGRTKK